MSGKILFMVRRQYFDAIVAGIKTEEVRRASKRWLTMASGFPDEAVFLCGRRIHRREITGTRFVETAAEALGRTPSEQGLKDIGRGPVMVFYLGAELPAPTKQDRSGAQ